MPISEQRRFYLAEWRRKNKEKIAAAQKRYRLKNIDKIRDRSAQKAKENTARHKKWLALNRDHSREYHREYYHRNKERLVAQLEGRGGRKQAVNRTREWRYANPAKRQEQCASRRAAKIRAVPRWLTREQRRQMQAIYADAREAGMTVDHIVPLRGKMVCGLHVPWNLQILSSAENARKGNSFLGD